ncbi:TIGR04086 family membrane protein [Tumebacillus permanentifrigoris]|uniref:Putative membrane protein (TIGR04086 family) n=1 Tax=Tumebacillus permanentifrigoris TaxID=378543 RepID=A0A316DSI7_9BACL|nr:TIGR04086 family membrane protein [Tumebacillus permanentifrigoris]PWK08976.1 putative membrane protein (TIGR04086 family) [Tumebacillus permanentifrigoris]
MKNNLFTDYTPNFGGTPVLYGLVAAFSTALISILVTTLLLGWTSIAEARLSSITYVLNMVAVVVGSMLAARHAGTKGWYYGALTGLCYAVLITLLGLLMVSGPLFNLNNLFQTILMGLIGAFGGMIGVNLRK